MHRFIGITALLWALTCLPASASGSGMALHLGRSGRLAAPLSSPSVRNLTIELWVRPATDSASAVLLFVGDSRSNGYGIIMHDGIGSAGGNSVSATFGGLRMNATGTSGSLHAGVWTHVALTRGDSEWRLYRNGSLVGRSTADPLAPTGSLLIGSGFEGDIDEVRLWDREQSPEEIVRSMARPLAGNETGLRLYFDMNERKEGVVGNRAMSSGAAAGSVEGMLSGESTLVESTLSFSPVNPPSVGLTAFPAHMQFIARGRDGFGMVTTSGTVLTPGFDSVAVELTRLGRPYAYVAQPLRYDLSGASGSPAAARFSLDSRIRAEHAEYDLRLVAIRGSERVMIAEGADLVSGDALVIAGQANAHQSDASVKRHNRYLRSFGIQTANENMAAYVPADTLWGLANAHGFGGFASGPLLTGVWGLRLQELISANHGIPVCIINGGAGGSVIEQNVPRETRADLSSIYGRLLYRAEQAGLREAIRAIFWYQGESNDSNGYAASFGKLYDAWHADYPNIEKIYLFQIRPGCVKGPHGALRELQRTLADTFPDIEVMSTAGQIGFDGCHYSSQGYDRIGEQIYRLVARDLYDARDTIGITPPDLERAYFTDSTRRQIALLYRRGSNGIVWGEDTVVGGALRTMAGAFYLDGVAGEISDGRTSGDTLFLMLRAATEATTISYLPDRPWYDDSKIIYQGPWLFNRSGLGALSFHRQPIGDAPVAAPPLPEVPTITSRLAIVPNPSSDYVEVTVPMQDPVGSQLTLVDMTGTVRLRTWTDASVTTRLDLSGLPSGVYLCRVGVWSRLLTIAR